MGNLATQNQQREITLETLAKLRQEAADEVDRLIGFLDASDEYSMHEREEAADDVPCDGTPDDEPSLGSFDGMTDQSKAWKGGSCDVDCEVDDCDREDDDPGEESDPSGDDCDNEPSLGWPEGHVAQGPGMLGGCDDREQGGHAVPPQDRTVIPGADRVHVENTYRRFLHGLSPEQRAKVESRKLPDSGVIVR